MKIRTSISAIALAACTLGWAQTIDPFYASNYTLTDLGSVPGVPPNYGGLCTLYNDPNTLLIGGSANSAAGMIYAVQVTRDVDAT